MQLLKALIPVVLFGSVAGCGRSGNDRWAATENTNVKIDFDKVNEAYKQADGPEDLEKRVNEIYEGKEVISVAVQDLDGKTQVVTGFFDRNTDGSVQDDEKIFTIRREITGDGQGNYQTSGYGPHYGYYHSPMMGVASGMMMGMMMTSMFRPTYVPMYTTPYRTSPARVSSMQSQRQSYRAQNPSRFSQQSATGRKYNPVGGGSRRSGGARFGVTRKDRARKPERLTA
jgi:hypothetical protein